MIVPVAFILTELIGKPSKGKNIFFIVVSIAPIILHIVAGSTMTKLASKLTYMCVYGLGYKLPFVGYFIIIILSIVYLRKNRKSQDIPH